MRRMCFLLRRLAVPALMTAMLLAMAGVPLTAQPATPNHPFYDARLEITLRGEVSNVLTKPTRGMLVGSHLMLATSSGLVDASLGRWGLQGKGALPVQAGQPIEATGVMKTFGNKQVFVVRSLTVGGRVYAVRNEHGIPIPPQARERAGQRATQKGESR